MPHRLQIDEHGQNLENLLRWASLEQHNWYVLVIFKSTLNRFKNYLFANNSNRRVLRQPHALAWPFKVLYRMFSTVAQIFQSSDDHLYCNIVLLLQSYHTLLQAFLIIYLWFARCSRWPHTRVCVFLSRIAERLIFRALTNEIKNKIFSFISEISKFEWPRQ